MESDRVGVGPADRAIGVVRTSILLAIGSSC